jgi:pyridinium-3,5-biscarboxylic acid mononucleotide sulfurtransferase
MTLAEKHARLRALIADCGSALVCYSGGVDSTLLLKVAHDVLGERCVAMVALSPTMAASERKAALELAAEMGARVEVTESHELSRPEFRQNPQDRCYYCKGELLDLARPLAERLGLRAVLLGTNTDDLGDYRPGLQAVADHGARQPLLDAGLSKAEVRELSRELGLATWNKPQLACLSSRFPYGTEITVERLRQVDGLEDGVRSLGFRQVRARWHGEIARLELEPSDIVRAAEPETRAAIVKLGRELGFTFVALDLAGFASGSMNQLLAIRKPVGASERASGKS